MTTLNQKLIGTKAGVTINGIDFQMSKCSAKIEQKKIEYEYIGGAWKRSIPGGVKGMSGSFEAAADASTIGSTYIAPFVDGWAQLQIGIPTDTAGDSHRTLTASVVISDADWDITPDLITIKANWSSDGPVTFA